LTISGTSTATVRLSDRRGPGRAMGPGDAGDLEPQPRRGGRVPHLVRQGLPRRPDAAGLSREAPRGRRRDQGPDSRGDRAATDPPRHPAAGEDAVADALRDRRPRLGDPGPEHRGPGPGGPPRTRRIQGRLRRVRVLVHRHRPLAAASDRRTRPWPAVLSERRPGPARRPGAKDLCPTTGRARLGYDRARVLLDQYTSPGDGVLGWDLHQLRHSAATHLASRTPSSGCLWPRPATATRVPSCATPNLVRWPSPRSPRSSTSPHNAKILLTDNYGSCAPRPRGREACWRPFPGMAACGLGGVSRPPPGVARCPHRDPVSPAEPAMAGAR
jgi:hypothetical protein